ncbi:MAG: PstS family phosphate ABC transporter substrate-binding protein [Phycisphaerae bacterium]|nr:PstS family phosphate ABC transporter substrate-binding protein [Phycisphaerae bacterium]
MVRLLSAAVAVLMLSVAVRGQEPSAILLDPGLSEYAPGQGVAGSVKSIGSDTMNNLMTTWMETFRRFYPAVTVEMEGKGSSTAPAALISGTAQLGPMSRPMKASEVDEFEKKFGYKPTGLRVAIDCLAVFVHKDNPLRSLSVEEVQRAYSVAGTDLTWDMLGVTDPSFKGKPVQLYGRNSASGTYGFFKEHALGGKDFKSSVKEQPGTSAVVTAVANDRFGIGYGGLGYRTAGVRAVALAAGGEPVEPSAENAYSGEYALARFLLVYVNKSPTKPLDPLMAEFVRMTFSRQGQEAVLKNKEIPLPAEIASEELRSVGLSAK